MSLVTVHYLSMNVRNGQVVAPAVTSTVSASFPFTSLNPSTAYRVNWGFGAATVNNKALTTNVATLTTAAAHNYKVGDVVTVAGVDATFNGTYTITVIGSATTFSYAKTNANVTSAAATGTSTAYTPVTTDGTGAVTVSNTWALAGTYTLSLSDGTTGQVVVQKTITAA